MMVNIQASAMLWYGANYISLGKLEQLFLISACILLLHNKQSIEDGYKLNGAFQGGCVMI